MNDDFLTRFRQPPRPEFAAALYQRISKPMQSQKMHPVLRSIALAAAVLALLAAAVLVFPPVRAFAEGVLHRVGGYAFQQGTPVITSGKGSSAITLDRDQDSISIHVASGVPVAKDAAGAAQLAGFAVLSPAYLPAGFSDLGDWYVVDQDNGKDVAHAYKGGTNHFLAINQWQQSAGQPPKTYTEEQLVDVTVRGQPGIWIPGAANDGGGKNALVWEENGITYSLISDWLPLDEMQKVAESLGK